MSSIETTIIEEPTVFTMQMAEAYFHSLGVFSYEPQMAQHGVIFKIDRSNVTLLIRSMIDTVSLPDGNDFLIKLQCMEDEVEDSDISINLEATIAEEHMRIRMTILRT